MISCRHTSSDATDAKDSEISEPIGEDNKCSSDQLDLNSNIPEPEEEASVISSSTKISNKDMPKIKPTNNQASTKLALKRLYGDCGLPALRPRRKRSSNDTCVCM